MAVTLKELPEVLSELQGHHLVVKVICNITNVRDLETLGASEAQKRRIDNPNIQVITLNPELRDNHYLLVITHG